eukprot:Nk52_evm6s2657 gene=Nk52_evmTU6s2657
MQTASKKRDPALLDQKELHSLYQKEKKRRKKQGIELEALQQELKIENEFKNKAKEYVEKLEKELQCLQKLKPKPVVESIEKLDNSGNNQIVQDLKSQLYLLKNSRKDEMRAMCASIERLESDIEIKENENTILREELEKIRNTKVDSSTNKDGHISQVERLEKEIAGLESDIGIKEKENTSLREELEKIRNTKVDSSTNKDGHIAEVERLEKEMVDLQSKVEELGKQLEEEHSVVNELERNLESKSVALSKLEMESKKVYSSAADHEQQVKKLKLQVAELEEQNRMHSESLHASEEHTAKMAERLEERDEYINNLEDKVSATIQAKNEIGAQFANLSASLKADGEKERLIKDLQTENEKLVMSISSYRNQIKGVSDLNVRGNVEHGDMEEKRNELEVLLENATIELSAVQDDLKKKDETLESTTNELSKLQDDLKRKEEIFNNTTNELSKLQEELKMAEQALDNSTIELAKLQGDLKRNEQAVGSKTCELQNELKGKKEILDNTTSELSKLQDELKEKGQMLESLTSKFSDLQDELKMKEQALQNSTNELSVVQSDLQRKDEILDDTANELSRLQDSLNVKDQILESMQNELSGLQDDLERKEQTWVKERENHKRIVEQNDMRTKKLEERLACIETQSNDSHVKSLEKEIKTLALDFENLKTSSAQKDMDLKQAFAAMSENAQTLQDTQKCLQDKTSRVNDLEMQVKTLNEENGRQKQLLLDQEGKKTTFEETEGESAKVEKGVYAKEYTDMKALMEIQAKELSSIKKHNKELSQMIDQFDHKAITSLNEDKKMKDKTIESLQKSNIALQEELKSTQREKVETIRQFKEALDNRASEKQVLRSEIENVQRINKELATNLTLQTSQKEHVKNSMGTHIQNYSNFIRKLQKILLPRGAKETQAESDPTFLESLLNCAQNAAIELEERRRSAKVSGSLKDIHTKRIRENERNASCPQINEADQPVKRITFSAVSEQTNDRTQSDSSLSKSRAIVQCNASLGEERKMRQEVEIALQELRTYCSELEHQVVVLEGRLENGDFSSKSTMREDILVLEAKYNDIQSSAISEDLKNKRTIADLEITIEKLKAEMALVLERKEILISEIKYTVEQKHQKELQMDANAELLKEELLHLQREVEDIRIENKSLKVTIERDSYEKAELRKIETQNEEAICVSTNTVLELRESLNQVQKEAQHMTELYEECVKQNQYLNEAFAEKELVIETQEMHITKLQQDMENRQFEHDKHLKELVSKSEEEKKIIIDEKNATKTLTENNKTLKAENERLLHESSLTMVELGALQKEINVLKLYQEERESHAKALFDQGTRLKIQEIETLQLRIQDLEDDIQVRRKEELEMKEALARLEAVQIEREERILEQKKTIEVAKLENENINETKQQMELSLRNAQEVLKGENDAIKHVMEELKRNLELEREQFTSKKHSFEESIDSLQDENSKYRQEINQIEMEFTELKKTYQSTIQHSQEMRQEIEELIVDNKKFKVNNDDLLTKIKEMEVLNSQQMRTEQSNFKDQIHDLQTCLSNKDMELEHLRESIYSRDKQIEGLTGNLQEQNSQVCHLQQNLTELKEYKATVEEEKKLLQEEIDIANDQLSLLSNTNKTIQSTPLMTHQASAPALKRHNSALLTNILEHSEATKDTSMKVDELERKLKRSEEKVSGLHKENDSLKGLLENSQSLIDRLQEQTTNTMEEGEKQRDKVSELNHVLIELKSEIASSAGYLKIKDQELRRLQSLNEESEFIAEKLKAKTEQLTLELKGAKLENEKLTSENESHQESLGKAQMEMAANEMKKDENLANTKERYENLLKESHEKLELYDQNMQKAQDENQILLANNETVKSQLESLKSEHHTFQLQSFEEKKILQTKIDSLEASKDTLQSDLSNLAAQCETQKRESAQIAEGLQMQVNALTVTNMNILEKQKEYERAQKVVIDQKTATIEDLISQNESLRIAAEGGAREIEENNMQLRALEQSILDPKQGYKFSEESFRENDLLGATPASNVCSLAKGRLCDLQNQVEQDEFMLHYLQSENYALETDKEATEQRAQALTDQLRHKQETIEREVLKREKLEQGLRSIELCMQTMKEENEKLKKDLKETRGQLEEYIELGNFTEEDLLAEKQKIKSWRESYGRLCNDYDNLKRKKDSIEDVLFQKSEILTEQFARVCELEELVTVKDSTIFSLKSEVTKQARHLSSLGDIDDRKKLTQLISELEKSVSQLSEEVCILEKDKEDLSALLHAEKDATSYLEEQVFTLKAKIEGGSKGKTSVGHKELAQSHSLPNDISLDSPKTDQLLKINQQKVRSSSYQKLQDMFIHLQGLTRRLYQSLDEANTNLVTLRFENNTMQLKLCDARKHMSEMENIDEYLRKEVSLSNDNCRNLMETNARWHKILDESKKKFHDEVQYIQGLLEQEKEESTSKSLEIKELRSQIAAWESINNGFKKEISEVATDARTTTRKLREKANQLEEEAATNAQMVLENRQTKKYLNFSRVQIQEAEKLIQNVLSAEARETEEPIAPSGEDDTLILKEFQNEFALLEDSFKCLHKYRNKFDKEAFLELSQLCENMEQINHDFLKDIRYQRQARLDALLQMRAAKQKVLATYSTFQSICNGTLSTLHRLSRTAGEQKDAELASPIITFQNNLERVVKTLNSFHLFDTNN